MIKLGSSTVTAGGTAPDHARLAALADEVIALREDGHTVVLVSSGAVACGRAILGSTANGTSVTEKQQLAALGQPGLMAIYQQLFAERGALAAQILLTRADLERRRGYLNARNTLLGLIERGIVPVVNENDTVATEEIRVGDNDTLSARVAGLVEADLLVMLTDRDGIFERDPARHADARLIEEVAAGPIADSVREAVGGAAGALGTGGMATKLKAAELARRSGCAVVVCHGRTEGLVRRVVAGERIGTRFHAEGGRVQARKRFLLSLGQLDAALLVDAGAAEALRSGRSLLAVGLRDVKSRFHRGDPVRVLDPDGVEVARGLVNYDAGDLRRLCGQRSADIVGLLGYHYGDEAMHRNNLVLL
ncbi:MAG TPA: glutamate 5-kinase [Xanthomonadaceae bacterium]|nr:glutamate 5-kinase [Xanthomonadaceae bacterium]